MARGLGSKKKWAQKAAKSIKERGTEGVFTEKAHRAGYDSPLQYAHKVLAAPEGKYDPDTRKQANYARNVN